MQRILDARPCHRDADPVKVSNHQQQAKKPKHSSAVSDRLPPVQNVRVSVGAVPHLSIVIAGFGVVFFAGENRWLGGRCAEKTSEGGVIDASGTAIEIVACIVSISPVPKSEGPDSLHRGLDDTWRPGPPARWNAMAK